MALEYAGYVELPAHAGPGGFDHAAVHPRRGRLYVAHTANDALDVIDCATTAYLHSIPGLTGVAGALVSQERDLVFTSNRGENTVGIFSPAREDALVKVPVGVRPNGLAYDAAGNRLLAANVSDPLTTRSFTVSIVDVATRTMIADIPVAGRTRWTVFDAGYECFYVNIADPPEIAVVEARKPDQIAQVFPIPAMGPHGLDLDPATRRLFCACDGKALVVLNAGSGDIVEQVPIAGVPDVIFFNPALNHLYVAIGEPGLIEVFETATMQHLETVPTERGTHTLAFDPTRDTVYAFLPETHRLTVYRDRP